MKPRYRYHAGLKAWTCFGGYPLMYNGAYLYVWPIDKTGRYKI